MLIFEPVNAWLAHLGHFSVDGLTEVFSEEHVFVISVEEQKARIQRRLSGFLLYPVHGLATDASTLDRCRHV